MRRLTVRAALKLLLRHPSDTPSDDGPHRVLSRPWPQETTYAPPVPRTRLGELDDDATVRTTYELPTFAARRIVPASEADLLFAYLPSVNRPPPTARQQRPTIAPAPAD